MKNHRPAFLLIGSFAVHGFTQPSVVLDDFKGAFSKPAIQNLIAATIEHKFGHSAGGAWHTWADISSTTKMVSGFDSTQSIFGLDTTTFDNLSITPAVKEYLHVILQAGPNTGWSWASIGCTFTGGTWGSGDGGALKFWDFSNLKAIKMKVRGNGSFMIGLQTEKVASLMSTGQHFHQWVEMDSLTEWTWKTVGVVELKSDQKQYTWDDAKKEVGKFFIETKAGPGDKMRVDLSVDSIVFVGMDLEKDFMSPYELTSTRKRYSRNPGRPAGFSVRRGSRQATVAAFTTRSTPAMPQKSYDGRGRSIGSVSISQ